MFMGPGQQWRRETEVTQSKLNLLRELFLDLPASHSQLHSWPVLLRPNICSTTSAEVL